jgi:hypothetical protein
MRLAGLYAQAWTSAALRVQTSALEAELSAKAAPEKNTLTHTKPVTSQDLIIWKFPSYCLRGIDYGRGVVNAMRHCVCGFFNGKRFAFS